MKQNLLLSLAVALIGVMSLALCAKPAATSFESADDPVRVRVDVDRTVLPAETVEKAVIKIALDCLQPPRHSLRPPVNLALVIDRSGSMAGDKIAKAREAALEAVRRLAPGDDPGPRRIRDGEGLHLVDREA